MAAIKNGGGGMGGGWGNAVPLEEMDGNVRPYPMQRADTGDRDVRTKQLETRSSGWDLQSDSEQVKDRRASLRVTNATAGKKRSRNALREKGMQDEQRESIVDNSAWIHRDKLAQIEIQEMADAGIYVRPSQRSASTGPARDSRTSSRSASQSGSRRPRQEVADDIGHGEEYAAAYPHQEAQDRRYDSQTGEEYTIEHQRQQEQQQQQHYIARPTTSRIPVSKISPVPVPQNVVDRESPLPRSRGGSQTFSGSWDEMQYARRARAGSAGSQVLLDDPEFKVSSNDESSPQKARVPQKVTPNSRKASTTSNRPGSSRGHRAASSSATKRPGSSSGFNARPPTAKASPEGEPPWIATMYKPDPRLPPDQQMLPTHAKRMMQQQWADAGQTGSIYDKDFNLLNNDDLKSHVPPLVLDKEYLERKDQSQALAKGSSPVKELSPNESVNGKAWPLSRKSENGKSDAGSVRPSTSGGYKITPTIYTPNTPTIHRSAAASPTLPQPATTLDQMTRGPTLRMLDMDEKDEAKPKKGCCCVVM